MQYPLEGIRVLDLSRVVSGPFAGRLLSDLGADVVKVEPPDTDGTRVHGRKTKDIGGFFNHLNAGKRNISLDLRAEGAADLVKALARKADVLIENYRPGVMDRLGIGYEVLNAENPALVMLSISGYGQGGPESHRPSYAPVVHAEAGLMFRLGDRNETRPGDLPLSVADTNASLHGVIAILAALRLRDASGHGQHIDLSMMDATVATDDHASFGLDGVPNTLPVCPIFDLSFGRVFIASDMKLLFRRLNRRDGMPDPAGENTTLEDKIRLRAEAIDARLSRCDSLDAFNALMEQLDLPAGIVRDPYDLAEQTTLKHREMIVHVDDRDGGTRPIVQSPYRFSQARSGVRGPAAHQGEHNDVVLAEWLDLTESEIAGLRERGVTTQSEHVGDAT